MYPDKLFQIVNQIAMIGWLMIVIFPLWKHAGKIAAGVAVQLLCLLYAALVINHFKASDFKNFGSLAGISSLFQNPWVLLAGWVHYLAFDLMMGLYIVRDAKRMGINHWLIVPVALLCFILGPTGLLVYIIIRQLKTQTLFDAGNR